MMLAIEGDVRCGLPAFLEGYSIGCHRLRCPVRPFSSCRAVSEQELIEFLEPTPESVSPRFEELTLPPGLTERASVRFEFFKAL